MVSLYNNRTFFKKKQKTKKTTNQSAERDECWQVVKSPHMLMYLDTWSLAGGLLLF